MQADADPHRVKVDLCVPSIPLHCVRNERISGSLDVRLNAQPPQLMYVMDQRVKIETLWTDGNEWPKEQV